MPMLSWLGHDLETVIQRHAGRHAHWRGHANPCWGGGECCRPAVGADRHCVLAAAFLNAGGDVCNGRNEACMVKFQLAIPDTGM
jgi:hypothetical protein